ncbi:serine hydrolase domain-containing protein [Actinacidiphila yeochonensis]|uniref:serine hydrolase domain-containing protein n=1 Tax=Actinacidiphila yeochonensis TaxID=89050 RepID=UPI00099D7E29|nr:serine hydrolase domain-containing protein [Actinacidiphila yeochonensis]
MTGALPPTGVTATGRAVEPAGGVRAGRGDVGQPDDGTAELLAAAVARVRAPDVAMAAARRGRRFVASDGTGPAPAAPREDLVYELGSLTKTFTVLLLADLADRGVLGLDDPLTAHLPGLPVRYDATRRITLRHLATHTSGLPRVPRDLVPGALLHPYANGYAGYPRERLLDALTRARPRHEPGTRWNYSNLGVALLGPALETAAGAPYPDLLARHVLAPLGLTSGTTRPPADLSASGAAEDGRTPAVGRRGDGYTLLPPTDMGAFAAAGALRMSATDLLTYAQSHLGPEATPIAAALRAVQVPQLRRGFGRRHTHTLTWLLHPAARGPLLFHAGSTFGQQSFAGFHPATGTAVAGVATRHDRGCAVVHACYGLLQELARLG